MNKYYYQKVSNGRLAKTILRWVGLLLSVTGMIIMVYIFSPLIIWQLTLAPAFAQQAIAVPIPQRTLVNPVSVKNLVTTSFASLGTDYNNAQSWYPHYNFSQGKPRQSLYSLTIPALNIINASVSTIDTDLSQHLVNLPGTALPPDKGNTVIFGHSTLPYLYNPKDYKTIFANAHTLKTGDEIIASVENVTYTYKIFSITVVDPDDTSVLTQTYDDSYLTIITCTPPGTIWKRLIVKARLQTL